MANVPRWASRSMWGGSVYKTARCSGLRSYSSTPLKSALGTLYTACQRDINIESIVVADVRTRSLETTKMTLIGQEKCFALQDNSRTWTFGSKVGSFEELEWRIVNTVGANNAAKQLSRTVYADQVDDGNDMSLEDEQKL
ncbi:hypothetical protein PC113_g14258 [Phytophthora cactorum]|uniref:Uncharacterized protein n=1 Tax=Phytophthora cactorum TaxID=29920 RepID=A0A8T1BK21_9STRA|nr:hypothetical protein PC112_g12696 [Phytophthora cactorum]KAG2853340.1 hypothetical protein PC113_g14258 [Phytophthora cactorum]KAG2890749.1 hypothetical protein PC114_g17308 [Phytophthora cactorum]KAG2903691.1 hypothetical protein PC115_g15220 [Phytophthora cactorum]KAG2919952.1 hypothetical protein PC117_g16648 [Phytophthora cactorum]